MQDEIDKILSLIHSGQPESILLAIELAEALDMDIESYLTKYQRLADWTSSWVFFYREELSDQSPLVRKLVRLFTQKDLSIRVSGTISQIPEEVFILSNLTTLNLKKGRLANFPKGICKLSGLKYLTLHHNDFSEIPPCIQQLHQLKTVDLRNNKITQLPKEITQLKQLERLDLRGNSIIKNLSKDNLYDRFPKELFSLPNLKVILPTMKK